MSPADLLIDAFGRIRHIVHSAVEGLTPEQLAFRIDGEANSIAWLIWHLTRIQDDHVADAAGLDQVWTSDGWASRFALSLTDADTGYGHSSDDVAAVRVQSPELLIGYHDAVYSQTIGYVEQLSEADLTRIVDESWDPPVSLGVRLVSVISDDLQHAGQAAFVRGIVTR
jgi:DinB superfamily